MRSGSRHATHKLLGRDPAASRRPGWWVFGRAEWLRACGAIGGIFGVYGQAVRDAGLAR
jgi:hypothetical protein